MNIEGEKSGRRSFSANEYLTAPHLMRAMTAKHAATAESSNQKKVAVLGGGNVGHGLRAYGPAPRRRRGTSDLKSPAPEVRNAPRVEEVAQAKKKASSSQCCKMPKRILGNEYGWSPAWNASL
jgi:NADPH-dependent glutamate synthase beta subunit-like oxidoreductase